eukprot:TRINITY_DN5053_c0_g1_i8.p1 TRINITY_DN5053_c0_g1~~TRINITY_DN5053_c0_g1_i8.p1  ORF type:complete len:141 (-),score=52.02 TRINITY_DN5053_c0_g1_i8:224-598(-)
MCIRDRDKAVVFDHQGERSHILFGHGLKLEDFQKRDFKTTYELTMSEKVKPQTAIYSKFYPEQTRTQTTFKPNGTGFKNYVTNLPPLGGKAAPVDPRTATNFKHYDEFTKTFDSAYKKMELRKQ